MNKNGLPGAIIFDLDGTLVDRPASIRRYAQRFTVEFKSSLLVTDINQIATILIAADGHGYRSVERPISIASELLSGVSPSEVDVHWRKHFPTLPVPARMAEQTIADLGSRRIPIGLVTNGSITAQTAKLAALGWSSAFPAPIISGAYDYKKPDPRIFEAALKQLDVSAQNAWFVGDHPVNDVWGAEQLGMRGFLLPGGPAWPEGHETCGTQIAHLGELIEYFDQ